MCDVYLDACEVWCDAWRQARRAHKCCACSEGIRPGDRYHYASWVHDGRAGSFKHCARCWAIFLALTDQIEVVDPRLACDTTWEDAFYEPPPPEVAALAFVSRDEAQGLAPTDGHPWKVRPLKETPDRFFAPDIQE